MTPRNNKDTSSTCSPAKVDPASKGELDVTQSYSTTEIAVKKIPPEAERALKEAEDRRISKEQSSLPKEVNGRNGPEPTRFGDWEKDGIASDF